MNLKPGTLLHGGTYKIEKELGQGSFGVTYLAVHTNLDKKVAIKEFFMKELNSRNEDGSITGMSDGSLSYDYCQKFQKEALNLSRLDHPNIVRVTDSFEDNGTFYYVMDYIEGMNLNDYVKKRAVSETEAISIMKAVADALIYMHEQKHMLHLDLKPGNIMRRQSDGHIFLIDFGLSKHYSNDGKPETSTTIGLGTAGYAPVEQGNRAKNGEFRPTIDVYALGATLYKLLTRETPPAASELVSDDELLAERMHEHSVSQPIVDFIVKAMMPNVKKRIQTIRSFKDQLPNSGYSSNASSFSSTAKSEDTIVANESGEETKLFNSAPKPVNHPNFTEASYAIESKYLNYPTTTKTKAEDGDLDALIAYGIMLLRGQGVPQDTDAAYSWFMIAKDKGDDRASKILSQWYMLKDKYIDKESKEPQSDTSSESGSKKTLIWVVAFIAAIVIGSFIFMQVKNSYNEAEKARFEAEMEASLNQEKSLIQNAKEWYVDENDNDIVYCMVEGERHESSEIPDGYRIIHYSQIANLDTYEGTIKNGIWVKGKVTFKNGDYFDGSFEANNNHLYNTGYGKDTSDDNEIYEGNWKNGLYHGYGVITWPNETRQDAMCKYEGDFYNGQITGNGKAYYVGFDYVKGKFKNGTCVSVTEEGSWW